MGCFLRNGDRSGKTDAVIEFAVSENPILDTSHAEFDAAVSFSRSVAVSEKTAHFEPNFEQFSKGPKIPRKVCYSTDFESLNTNSRSISRHRRAIAHKRPLYDEKWP